MTKVSRNSTGSFTLTTEYSGSGAVHIDQFFCGGVNLWRDVFTPQQIDKLVGCKTGETVLLEQNFQPAKYDSSLRRRVHMSQWQPPDTMAFPQKPRFGRWYPGGLIHSLPGIYPQSILPVRIVGVEHNHLEVDCNHPLSGKDITLRMTANELSVNKKERGGRCTAWIEEALINGPGIEIPPMDGEVDFDEADGMVRLDNDDDTGFYGRPRLVNHIDTQAREHLLKLSDKFITADMRVLDLMSSIQSHLPADLSAVGLGMNIEEMRENPALTDHLVHDLNISPAIPLPDKSFEAVCCHLSFEYLLRPQEILSECSRMLTDNGLILISFSNRWFPEKVTRIWAMLHEFERVGYVTQYITENFTDIRTFSYRNWPRPEDDPHFMQLQTSDPIYAVVARKKNSLTLVKYTQLRTF